MNFLALCKFGHERQLTCRAHILFYRQLFAFFYCPLPNVPVQRRRKAIRWNRLFSGFPSVLSAEG